MKTAATTSVLLAGLLAIAGATHAQVTTPVPLKAGEASTMTDGRPNMNPNQPVTGVGGDPTIRDRARPDTSATPTSRVPVGAGEASTVYEGRPNVNPNQPLLNKTDAEIAMEKQMKKAEAQQRRSAAIMSQRGAHVGEGPLVPQVSPAGNPPYPHGTPK